MSPMAAWSRFHYAAALVLCLSVASVIAAQGRSGQPVTSNVTVGTGLPEGLTLSVFSASYQATLAQAAVVIGAEVQGLVDPSRANGGQLDVRFAVSGGPTEVAEQLIAVPLQADAARRQAQIEGVRVLAPFKLAPGRYRVRVTVGSGSQDTGSVAHDFDVPVLAGENSPIHMSDLSVTSSAVGGLTHSAVEGDQRALPVLGRPPTGRRAFSTSEQLEVHAEFYEKVTDFGLDQDIFVTTRIWSRNGDLLWETRDSGTSEKMSGDRFGYAHSTLVPIDAFAPGSYVVEVEAETLYGVTTFVSRSLPINIFAAR
jgi:hypothetical protein